VGEYLSFVMFQLRDYAITLSSVSQAIALSVPKEDAKLAERVERLRHTVGELNGKLARLLGDKSALTMTAPPTQTAVDLPSLTRAIRAEALAAFSPSSVTVEILVQGDVPPVSSDRRSIELALLSVLQNSLEACSARGHGAVSILIHREETFVAIEVSDDGGGIAETIKLVVFEPFAASRAGSHGLGLGLSMSRRFIERIGGGLRLKSKGGYTAARLEIPIDKELPRIRNEESTWAGRRAGT
jgi:C4-dicarboxylate-specific signal transduction histidine kinase